jgi:hypothetical protein
MLTYSHLDALKNFAEILDKAKEGNEILIEGEDGVCFIVKLLPEKKTNYNLPTINLDLSRDEIVEFVREARTR